MAARRCSTCNVNWPSSTTTYATCPTCGVATDYRPNAEALSREEAEARIAHHRFEQFLEGETDAQREAREQAVARAKDERMIEFPFGSAVIAEGRPGRVVDTHCDLADVAWRLVRFGHAPGSGRRLAELSFEWYEPHELTRVATQ